MHLRLATAGLLAIAAVACTRPSAPPSTEAPSSSAVAVSIKEPAPTTSPEIAILNFHAQLAEIERHLRLDPKAIEWQRAAIQTRRVEVSALGIVSSLDRIVEMGDRIVSDHPNDATAWLARASARSAVHDFAGASAALDRASELGGKPQEIEAARAGLALAIGRFDEAHATYSARIAANPTTNDLLMDGLCLAAMGKTDEADDAMQRAADLYADVSPFMIAWIYFERGNLWDRAGKLDLAQRYYRIALDRLPQYAHAALHLAQLVPAAEAKALLAHLSADDPEVIATPEAYDHWMKKYPLAFADHAGWFYLSRDPRKALEAAEINLANRKTPDAYELALAARLAAKIDACALADEALQLKYPSAGVRLRAASAYDRCGRKDDARRARLSSSRW